MSWDGVVETSAHHGIGAGSMGASRSRALDSEQAADPADGAAIS